MRLRHTWIITLSSLILTPVWADNGPPRGGSEAGMCVVNANRVAGKTIRDMEADADACARLINSLRERGDAQDAERTAETCSHHLFLQAERARKAIESMIAECSESLEDAGESPALIQGVVTRMRLAIQRLTNSLTFLQQRLRQALIKTDTSGR